MVGFPHCCRCVRYSTGLHIPRQSSASHPLPLMVTLLCVIDQPSRSVAPSVSPPSSAPCATGGNHSSDLRPQWHQLQLYSREFLAIFCAVTTADHLSLPLGRCILSSSSGGSLKTAPKLLRSISAVTALIFSQIGTSLT